MEITKISEDDLQVNKCLIDWPQVPILESPSVCSAIHGVDSVTEIIIVVLLSWDTNAAPGNVRKLRQLPLQQVTIFYNFC